jgi:hypothetical protein
MAHQNPNNPTGSYIHPIHKKCLLGEYRINQFANCYICSVPLNMQTLVPARPLRTEVVALRSGDVIDQVAYAMFASVIPSALNACYASHEWNIARQNNQTNTQDVGIQTWYPDVVAYLAAASIYLGAVSVILGGTLQNETARDSFMGATALVAAHAEMHFDKMALGIAGMVLWHHGAQVVPIEEIRDFPKEMLRWIKFFKKEIVLGATIGLGARMIDAEVDVQHQRAFTAMILIGSLMATAIAKGIWRATHPHRN